MANKNSAITLGKQIRTLFDAGALGAMPDRGLLDHFARGGETSEAAFVTLVERHGPMVLRVCRHLLADSHLAEDAFQVTFLLLARRARSLHDPDALAGWLHRVARRVALRARAGIRRRNDRETSGPSEIAVAADNFLERDELRAIVHEEIDRLAEAQRLPILLCALEGLSHEEAAQRLRWPVGTVKSRLVRGRRRLEGRLARRGLAPALALAAAVAPTPASAAPVPLALAVATTRAALASAGRIATTAGPVSASVSTTIALLLQRELSAMLLANLKLAAGAALVAGAASVLIGLVLASPLGRPAQAITPQLHQAQTPDAKLPVVAPADLTSIRKTDRGIPESQPLIPRQETANQAVAAPERRLSAFGEQVQRAIHEGVRFLKAQQRPDGSWADVESDSKTGVTSLVTLALVTAGEKPDSPTVRKALEYLRAFGPNELRSTYAISLQTMVYADAEPERDQLRIVANANWLERAQIRADEPQLWPGSWTYSDAPGRPRPGDNSNTQYALLGLSAASEVGVAVKPSVWELSRSYWERSQKRDGSWAYTPDSNNPTASMTCAGVSSLAIAGLRRFQGQEILQGEAIRNCGNGGINQGDAPKQGALRIAKLKHAGDFAIAPRAIPNLQAGIDWLANHFQVGQNFGGGQQWKLYYLYGLERAGRLAGIRFFGDHDWYRLGAEELVQQQDKPGGYWQGALVESNKVLATSFALLFLAKGRAPVLINKLRHAPSGDWDNDPDDVRNIVGIVSRDWKHILTWQVVDSQKATVPDLLRAPILFINGHSAPEFTVSEKKNLREYVDRGGRIFAEACCGSAGFDRGFKKLMEEVFTDKQEQLRTLADDHPVWRARHLLSFEIHPLWGISRGGRTAVIYSPKDLSCYWNQSERSPANPAVIRAIQVGQNVIDYVTGRKLPADKLSDP